MAGPVQGECPACPEPVEGSERSESKGSSWQAPSRAGPTRMAFCYILRCVDGSYYVGSTDDLDARLVKHRDGSASGFTAARRPVALAYSEVLDSIEAARARERQLKGWTHAKQDALTQADAGRLKALSRSNSSNSSKSSPRPSAP